MYKIGVSDDLVGTSKNDVALITIYHSIKLIIENIIKYLMSLALFFVAQSMRRESPSNEDLLLLLTRQRYWRIDNWRFLSSFFGSFLSKCEYFWNEETYNGCFHERMQFYGDVHSLCRIWVYNHGWKGLCSFFFLFFSSLQSTKLSLSTWGFGSRYKWVTVALEKFILAL